MHGQIKHKNKKNGRRSHQRKKIYSLFSPLELSNEKSPGALFRFPCGCARVFSTTAQRTAPATRLGGSVCPGNLDFFSMVEEHFRDGFVWMINSLGILAHGKSEHDEWVYNLLRNARYLGSNHYHSQKVIGSVGFFFNA